MTQLLLNHSEKVSYAISSSFIADAIKSNTTEAPDAN